MSITIAIKSPMTTKGSKYVIRTTELYKNEEEICTEQVDCSHIYKKIINYLVYVLYHKFNKEILK